MTDQEAYLIGAEKSLTGLLRSWRDRIVSVQGNVVFTVKDDETVVTKLDSELEQDIKKTLTELDANVGFLGEESGQEGPTDRYWLIDPIDGTESFIRGMASYRAQLAYVVNGEAVFAMAYRFVADELYSAHKGQGLFKNGQPQRIKLRPLDRCWIEMSLDLTKPVVQAAFSRLRPRIKGMMVTRDYLNIVDGKLDGYISYGGGGGPWDYVPRFMLLQEAGAKVGNINTDIYDDSVHSILAVHPEHFKTIQKLLSL